MQIILVAAVFAGICVYRIGRLGQELDRTADAYSEANSIRAADAYLSEGFTSHYGLQRIVYGERFPDVGAVQSDQFLDKVIPPDKNSFVYTHYPPGPDYIIAVTAMVSGLDDVSVLRITPVAFTLLALVALMVVVSRASEFRLAGPMTGVVLIAAPIFCRYAVVMHLQCYTTAAMLLAVAVAIHAFWIAGKLSWMHVSALALLGFFQGWLSFDYCFVATFFAVPVWLLARADGRSVTIRAMVIVVLVSGAAFTFAHGLHLLQVAGETGGIAPAMAELAGSARYRAGVQEMAHSEVPHRPYPAFVGDAVTGHLRLAFDGFKDASKRETFGFSMLAILLAVAVTQLGRPRFLPLAAIVAAFVIGLAWCAAMPQHATVHGAFTVRHLLLAYVCAWLALALWAGRSAEARA